MLRPWLVVAWAVLVACSALHAQETRLEAQPSTLRGTVDSIRYEPDQRRLEIQGWSFDAANALAPSSFGVQIDGQEAIVRQTRLVTRADVNAAFPGVSPARAGFLLDVQTPGHLGWGRHRVSVTAHWNQALLELAPVSPLGQSFSGLVVPARHWWLVAILGVFFLGWFLCQHVAKAAAWALTLNAAVERNIRLIALMIVSLFAALVAVGWTGLSLQLLTGVAGGSGEHAFFSPETGTRPVALTPRAIRSDEWLVITPSALAQVNHQPPFPVVNDHLGTTGQNMMVIGMTGVPVLHPSALARPATWGFFVLPLANALAWYWFFPFFACLLALWAFLNQIAPTTVARNLALSLLFCLAPYATGWSHWPLYAAFFAVAALSAVICMAQARSTRRIWLLSAPLGLLVAGFALVLYPPWQIPLALLCSLLLLAWCMDNRPRPKKVVGLALLFAASVAAALLAAWWLDARDAVATMQNTVYPGGRKALQGGEFPLYWLTRGYSNLDTLSHLGASEVNASEFGAYFFLPFPLALLAWQLVADKHGRHRWMAWAWIGFTAWALVFVIFGVPLWLSKALFWHFVPSHRVDLALALGCTVLLALVPPRPRTEPRVQRTGIALPWIAACASAGLVALALLALPQVLYPSLSPVLITAMAACGFFIALWLAQGRTASALSLSLLLYVLAGLGFNPVAKSPHQIQLHSSVRTFLQLQGAQAPGSWKRVLTVSMEDGMTAAMSLAAAGVPVVNGVFYYPQFALWENMHLSPADLPIVNRYQHLFFVPGEVDPPSTYRVSTRSQLSDAVFVTLNAENFDFDATGAQVVLAKEADTHKFLTNPQLSLLGKHAGWSWFAVHPQ